MSASKTTLFVFDLDGTLVDSTEGIVFAVNSTLEHFKRTPLPREVVVSRVGLGVRSLLKGTMEDAVGEEFEAARRYLLQVYYDHCTDHATLYPGVVHTLETLKQRGKQLAICTNKPLKHSEKTLADLKIAGYFSSLVAGDSMAQAKPHPMVLEHILEREAVAPGSTVMIGDSNVDIEVGKRAGTQTCGCTYGLRPVAELRAAAPDVIVDRIDQVLEFFA